MTTYVGCPGCGVKYPLKQLYHHAHDRPSQSRVYTVVCVTVQTSGVELAEGLLMTAGLSVNSRYEPKNSRRSDTQIPSSLNSYRFARCAANSLTWAFRDAGGVCCPSGPQSGR